MNSLYLSVIIPTRNRKEILEKCIVALFNQTLEKSQYEIIVVDDGSTDGTTGLVGCLINDSPCVFKYFQQKAKGPAAARNTGIENAKGEIILFMGDDIIAAASMLEQHYKWHTEYTDDNMAVLGYVTWSPQIKITPFMKWLESGGPQFHYWQIKDAVEVDAQNYFYTANISLKRKFLWENNEFFQEEFPYAAFEDLELGYRLKKRGMILKFNKEAVGYHYHFTSFKDYRKRAYRTGISSVIFHNKIKDVSLDELLSKTKKLNLFSFKTKLIFCNLFLPIFVLFRIKSLIYKSYDVILQKSFLLGVKAGPRDRIK